MDINHQKPIYVTLPGIEIYLTMGFLSGIADRPPNKHTHPCFEIVCLRKNKEVYFTVIPPLVEHFSKTTKDDGRLCSFLFSFTDDSSDDICQIIRKLNKIIEIKDTFDGITRIEEIQKSLQRKEFGSNDLVKAEFRLFFVKLAQVFYTDDKTEKNVPQTLDDERIALLENF